MSLPLHMPPNLPFRAGWVYFGMIYALGFLLGAVRETWLAPRFGSFWPRMFEMPFMLAASWFAAWWVVNRYGLEVGAQRMIMGLTAFVLLMVGEALVSMFAMGRTFAQHVAAYVSLQGGLTLAALAAFAVFPLIVRLVPDAPDGDEPT
ncbi:MAG: hypothetical protein ACRCWO_04855 [Bosea sp. (in: a-proteobacteria)]